MSSEEVRQTENGCAYMNARVLSWATDLGSHHQSPASRPLHIVVQPEQAGNVCGFGGLTINPRVPSRPLHIVVQSDQASNVCPGPAWSSNATGLLGKRDSPVPGRSTP